LKPRPLQKQATGGMIPDRGNFLVGEGLYKILEIEEIPENTDKYEYYISLIHPDDREKACNYFSTKQFTGDITFEYRLITPKGNLKYFRALRGEMVRDESGNPKRSFGVLQDITETRLSVKEIKTSQAELLEAQTIGEDR